MTPEMKEHVASVLEKAAAYIEAQEQQKTASHQNTKLAAVQELGVKYQRTTGESLPDSVLDKLAHTDEELIGVIEKMARADHADGDPDDLGAPGDREDGNRVYATVKEAQIAKVREAEDRFLSWIVE